jgi:hypothetical protein
MFVHGFAGFRRLVEECLGNEQEAANLLDRYCTVPYIPYRACSCFPPICVCFSPDTLSRTLISFAISGAPVCLYTLFRCVGVLLDHCLLALSAVAFVLAAVCLDTSAKLEVRYTSWDNTTRYNAYSFYTIPTFFKSFSVRLLLHLVSSTSSIIPATRY